MTAEREKALHNLLYALRCVDHLYEAGFYHACMSEAGIYPPATDQQQIDAISEAGNTAASTLVTLFAKAGLPMDYNIGGNPEVVRIAIQKVQRAINRGGRAKRA